MLKQNKRQVIGGIFLLLAMLAAAELSIDKTTAIPLETVTLTVTSVQTDCIFTVVTPSGHTQTFSGTISGNTSTATYIPSYMTGLYTVSAVRDGQPTNIETFTVGTPDWGDQINLSQWQVSLLEYFPGEPITMTSQLQNFSQQPLSGFSNVTADALPNHSSGAIYIQRKIKGIDAEGNILTRLYIYFDTTGRPNILGQNYGNIYAGTQVDISLYSGDGVLPLAADIAITPGFWNNADEVLTSSLVGNQWTVGVSQTIFQRDKIAYLDFLIPPDRSLSDVTFSVDSIQYNRNTGGRDHLYIGQTSINSNSFPVGNTFETGFSFSTQGRFPIRLPLNPRPAGLVYYHVNYVDFPGHSLNDGTLTASGGIYSNQWIWKRPVQTTASISFFADKWGYQGARGQAIPLTPEPPTRQNLIISDYQLDEMFYTEGEMRQLTALLQDESEQPITGYRTHEPVVDSSSGRLSIVSQNVKTDQDGNAVVRLLLYFDATGSNWCHIYAGTHVEISLFGPDGKAGADPNILIHEGGINTEGYIASTLLENGGIYDWIVTVEQSFIGADRQAYLDVIIPPGHSPSEVVYAVNRIVYRCNQEWSDSITIKNTTVGLSAFPLGGSWNTFEFKQGDRFGNLGYFPLYLSLNPNDRGLIVRMDGGVDTAVAQTLQATSGGQYTYSHSWSGDAGPDYQTQFWFSRYGYFNNKALTSEQLPLFFSGEPRYLGGLDDTPVLLGTTWQKDLNDHFFVDRDLELVTYETSDARVTINGSIVTFSPASLDETISDLILTARSIVDPNISASSVPFTLYAGNCLESTDCEDLGKPCKCILYQCTYYEPTMNYHMNPQGCDLSVFNQDVSMSTLFPLPGQEVQICADVYNKGTTYAFEVNVTFYLNEVGGTIIDTKTLPVVPITYMHLPFRSEQACVNWVVPQYFFGPHRIWVEVQGTCPGIDAEDMLSNNYATLDFFVIDPDMETMDAELIGGCPIEPLALLAVPSGMPGAFEGYDAGMLNQDLSDQNCDVIMLQIPLTVQVCEDELQCAPITGYEHSYWDTWYWPSWSGYCQHFDVDHDMIRDLILTYEMTYGIISEGPTEVSVPSLTDIYDYLTAPPGWSTGHLPCHPEPTTFPDIRYEGVSAPCAGLCPVSAWDCGQGITFQPKYDSPYYNVYGYPIVDRGDRIVTRCESKADWIEVPYQICYPYDSPDFTLPFAPFAGGLNEDGGYGPDGPAPTGPGGSPPIRFELQPPTDNGGNSLNLECYFCSTGASYTNLAEDIIYCYAKPAYNEILLRKGWNMWAVTLDPLDAAEERHIDLSIGWNLIGHSSPQPIDWSEATVSDGLDVFSIGQAEAAGWLQGTIYYRDAGQQLTRFVTGHEEALRTNTGYWLYAVVDNLTLTLPAVGGALSETTLLKQDIAVSYGGQIKTLADAYDAGWLNSRIYEYNTLAAMYNVLDDPADVLRPWKGYLIQSHKNGVRLITGPAPQAEMMTLSTQITPVPEHDELAVEFHTDQETTLWGSAAPAFVLPDTDGQLFDLAKSPDNGILLVFGNTSCPACVNKLPLLDRLHEASDLNNLHVIYVVVGETRESALRFVDRYNIQHRVLVDTAGHAARLYRIRQVPQAFLLDDSGFIITDSSSKQGNLWELLN